MTDYTSTELLRAKIEILRGRVELSIANESGSAMLDAVTDAVADNWSGGGVRKAPSSHGAAHVIRAAQSWVRDALASIDDDAAIERIEADRAAAEGPIVRVAMDRLAERLP